MSKPSKSKRTKSNGAYREFGSLVLREGAKLPDRCAICNQPCEGEGRTFEFKRDKAGYVEVAAVQSVFNAAADLMQAARYTGPVEVSIPLCSWHNARRLFWAGIGGGLLVLAIGFLLIERAMGVVIVPPGELGFLDMSLANYIACGMILVGIYFVFASAFETTNLWFKPKKFYDRHVWVIGAGRAFLSELPEFKHQYVSSDHVDADTNTYRDENHLSAEELIRRGRLPEDD